MIFKTDSIGGFFYKTQNTILSAAFVLSASAAVNALIGFLKGRFLAYYFGVSDELAVFYTADRIPNLVYSILVVGALSTVFVPVFTDLLSKDKERAYKTASSMVNATMLCFAFLALLIFALAPQVFNALALGRFTQTDVNLGASLMRMMLLGQLVLIAGNLLTSVLQSYKYFLVPALAPVLYNLGMFFGIIFLSRPLGIYGPAVGVIIGATLHLAVQLPLIAKTGFRPKLSLDLKDKELIKALSLVPPRVLSVFIANAIGIINNSLVILISAASVVHLKFATQLQFFPVGLFGASIATAALPTLSQEGAADSLNYEKFKKTFLTSLHQTVFLVVPISVVLLVLRVPVVRVVYGVSNFPWDATIKTSYILAFFSLSIFAQSANYLLTRAFYSLKDTLTPALVSIITALLNVLVSVILVVGLKFGAWSVALSFSLTSVLDMVVLLVLLSKKTKGFGAKNVLVPLVKIGYSGLLMGLTLYIPVKLLDKIVFDTTRTFNLLVLTGIAGVCGMATYLFFTKALRVEEIELFYKILRKLKIVQKPIYLGPVERSTE